MKQVPDLVADRFRLTGNETGERSVQCPLHDDHANSASINMDKQVFFCHAGCGGFTFTQLEEKLIAKTVAGAKPTMRVSGGTIQPSSELTVEVDIDVDEYLAERGFPDRSKLGIEVEMDNGYLMFGDTGVGRDMAPEHGRPRYRNPSGASMPLIWIGERQPDDAVWLVEGIFDALSLHALHPTAPVAAALGASLSDKQAYELRDRTVFILYDNDQTGYKESRRSKEKLEEYNANAIILTMPEEMGKDLNDALVNSREDLELWVAKVRGEYTRKDDVYVNRLFRGNWGPINFTPTGVESWDNIMNGGFYPGVHTVGAEPGIGKTSWVIHFAYNAAEEGKRVLVVSNEVPKRQYWARGASRYSPHKWADIEREPTIVDEDVIRKLEGFGTHLKVAVGWSLEQIKYVAPHYDIVVVDYLQRMPTKYKGDRTKANVDHNISALSDLGRDLEIPVVAISSLPRDSYGTGGFTKRSFKESGNIEYVSQTLTGFTRIPQTDKIMGHVVKNTRGNELQFVFTIDLAHQRVTTSTQTMPHVSIKAAGAQASAALAAAKA
jgi:phenylpyruvate tautomerase PptA (4-oxalocrotonate tautomerase family)/5S rRNA maturation endonuclease (ribonuclease M5)